MLRKISSSIFSTLTAKSMLVGYLRIDFKNVNSCSISWKNSQADDESLAPHSMLIGISVLMHELNIDES